MDWHIMQSWDINLSWKRGILLALLCTAGSLRGFNGAEERFVFSWQMEICKYHLKYAREYKAGFNASGWMPCAYIQNVNVHNGCYIYWCCYIYIGYRLCCELVLLLAVSGDLYFCCLVLPWYWMQIGLWENINTKHCYLRWCREGEEIKKLLS